MYIDEYNDILGNEGIDYQRPHLTKTFSYSVSMLSQYITVNQPVFLPRDTKKRYVVWPVQSEPASRFGIFAATRLSNNDIRGKV